MKGLRSVTILGEGFQVTLTIQLDVRRYEPFKDCKGAWKADPFFPLLATSVLKALHLSYHSLPRPCLPSGLWVLWQPEGLLSSLSFSLEARVGSRVKRLWASCSQMWIKVSPLSGGMTSLLRRRGGGGVTKKKGRKGRGLSPGFC